MSNRQLEEMQEEEANRTIASELGITYEEFCELDYDIDSNESSDGLVYDYVLTFSDDSSEEILKKISGLDSNNSVRIQESLFDN